MKDSQGGFEVGYGSCILKSVDVSQSYGWHFLKHNIYPGSPQRMHYNSIAFLLYFAIYHDSGDDAFS